MIVALGSACLSKDLALLLQHQLKAIVPKWQMLEEGKKWTQRKH